MISVRPPFLFDADMIKDDERKDRVNENVTLIQKKNGLTFGTDAYLLHAYMKKKPGGLAVELGAGSGIVSLLALTREKFAHVHAIEVQPAFAALMERNAAENHLSDRLTVHGKDLRKLASADIGREADVVFANPPYMKVGNGKKNQFEEKYAARHEVFGEILDFCQAAFRLLRYGGSFYLVYRPDRLSDLMAALRQSSFEPKRMTFVHADISHAPSLVLIEAKKGGGVGLYLTKPLFLCREDGSSSEEIRFIYENGVFHEQFERPGRKE